MESLPDELIVHIFSSADDSTVLLIRQLSKYYHDIVHLQFIQICETKPILKSEIVTAVTMLKSDSYRLGYLTRLDSTKPIKYYYQFNIDNHNFLNYEYYTKTYLATYNSIGTTRLILASGYCGEHTYNISRSRQDSWLTNIHTLESAPFNSVVYDVDLKTEYQIRKLRKIQLEYLRNAESQIIRKLDSILNIYETAISNLDGAQIMRIHGYLEMNARVHQILHEFSNLDLCVSNFNPDDSSWQYLCAEIKLFYQKLKEIYQIY